MQDAQIFIQGLILNTAVVYIYTSGHFDSKNLISNKITNKICSTKYIYIRALRSRSHCDRSVLRTSSL